MKKQQEEGIEVFGTKEVSVKEFMGSSDKSLMLLSNFSLAKENLIALNKKHESRAEELIAIEKLSPAELKELNTIRGELREPRYLVQKIEKNNISVFESYKKTDKANLKELVDVNKDLEDKVDVKIKAEEERKKNEKAEDVRLEQLRVDNLKKAVDDFESASYKIIQETNITNVELHKTMLDALVNADFDYEEYDILFEQAKSRVQTSWDNKCSDIQEKENQRLENERLEKENAEAKRLSDLQAFRLNEILPYVAFGEPVDLTNLSGLEEMDYSSILASKKALFEADEKEKQKEQETKEAAEKSEKDAVFEIRKNRLAEIGFEIKFPETEYDAVFYHKLLHAGISWESIYECNTLEFENIFSDAKLAIEKAKSDAKEETLKKRKETLESVSLLKEEITHIHSEKTGRISFKDLYNCEIVSDEDFNFVMDEVRASQKAFDEQLAKDDAERLKKENKERVKRLSADKFYLQGSLTKIGELLYSEISNAEFENEETEDFRKSIDMEFSVLIEKYLTKLEKI